MARTLLSAPGMRARIVFFSSMLLIAGCGGSVNDAVDVTDGGADGTADSSRTDAVPDAPTDTAPDAPVDVPPPDVACTDCISGTLSWGVSGGFVAHEDGSSVTACRTYEHHQGPIGGTADKTCTQELPACGAAGGVLDIERALAEPDMIAAFAAAPIMYGEPVPDGGIFVIKYGSKEVRIAFDCEPSRPDCKPIPAGVQRARGLLTGIDTAQLATGSCKGVFGASP